MSYINVTSLVTCNTIGRQNAVSSKEKAHLIISFRDNNLEGCWSNATCDKIHHAIRQHVVRKLDLLEFATSLEDLMRIPGCEIAPLHGKQAAHMYTLRVDTSWVLIFRYDNGFCDVWLKRA